MRTPARKFFYALRNTFRCTVPLQAVKPFADTLLFDRTRLGRVDRATYWRTMLGYLLVFAAAFFIPLELAYRLQAEPGSVWMIVWFNAWVLLVLAAILPIWRMTRRRLHDAGFSGRWQWLVWLPPIGWAVLLVLLLRPSQAGLNRYDFFAESDGSAAGRQHAGSLQRLPRAG